MNGRWEGQSSGNDKETLVYPLPLTETQQGRQEKGGTHKRIEPLVDL